MLELRSNSLEFASLIVGGLPGGTDPQVNNNEKPLFYRDKFFFLRRAFLAQPILCGFLAPDFANLFFHEARAGIVLAMPATAGRYMQLARLADSNGSKLRGAGTIEEAIGHHPRGTAMLANRAYRIQRRSGSLVFRVLLFAN